MKYRKKPIIVDAVQWFKNGDHPEDNCVMFPGVGLGQGKIVRRYNNSDDENKKCGRCGLIMKDHGWIDTLICHDFVTIKGGHIVCPGDYIITGIKGEHYPCKPDIFNATYELEDDNGK